MRRKLFAVVIVWLGVLGSAFATSQLIVNGGFTGASTSPWVAQGNGVQPEAGYISMGNADGAVQEVYQTVTLPTNLIAATLSLEYQTISADPNGDDYLTVYISDANLSPLIDLGTTSSGTTTSGWDASATNFISYTTSGSLSAYAGQTVNVEFYVTTDPNYGYLTSFDLTDIGLVVATTADIPANDNFTNATLVPAPGITNDVVTKYASREPGEPEIVGNPGGHSLWWTWTATSLGTVTVNVPDSVFTPMLGVYTGSSVSDLTLVTNGAARPLTFAVTPGTQYHVALDGVSGQSGAAVFIFRFTHDSTPPVASILTPAAGANLSASTVVVHGTASDNVAVASVYYRLTNTSGVTPWELTTGTTAWSASITNLIPGTNTVQIEAYDTSTNISKIVSRAFNYVVPVPLSLTIVGEGTVTGAKNAELLSLNDSYRVTATATPGFAFRGWTGDIVSSAATVTFVMASNFNLTATFADVTKPTLSIVTPVAKQRWSNSVFTVTGKAKDNVGVAAVWYQLNTAPWTSSVNTSNAFTNWNVPVTLTAGANTIRAYSVDAAGNISLTNSVSFIYVPSATLLVQSTGLGSYSPNYNEAVLAIGTNYAMTATAEKGYVFSNWTAVGGAVITNGPVLKFVMASNLDFIANFVLNPFPVVAGTYGGLFYNTGEMAPASSGLFSALVSSNGSFTAKFQQGMTSYSTSGQFSLTGYWSTPALKTWGNTAISLQLDMTDGNILSGNLNNTGWTAELGANRDVFAATKTAPQRGSYTLILPASDATAGNGFGAVTVLNTGAVSFSGTLGDGTKVTEATVESEQGEWPMYISLDKGAGMLLGWLEFTNEPGEDIEGTLNWFDPGNFTNQIDVVGSTYLFTKGKPVLNLSQGSVFLQGGGLTSSITDGFKLSASSIVTGSNKLALTIATTTGLFQGTATNAQGKTVTISGAVLQNQTNGFGQFLNAGQIGNASLAPQ